MLVITASKVQVPKHIGRCTKFCIFLACLYLNFTILAIFSFLYVWFESSLCLFLSFALLWSTFQRKRPHKYDCFFPSCIRMAALWSLMQTHNFVVSELQILIKCSTQASNVSFWTQGSTYQLATVGLSVFQSAPQSGFIIWTACSFCILAGLVSKSREPSLLCLCLSMFDSRPQSRRKHQSAVQKPAQSSYFRPELAIVCPWATSGPSVVPDRPC